MEMITVSLFPSRDQIYWQIGFTMPLHPLKHSLYYRTCFFSTIENDHSILFFYRPISFLLKGNDHSLFFILSNKQTWQIDRFFRLAITPAD